MKIKSIAGFILIFGIPSFVGADEYYPPSLLDIKANGKVIHFNEDISALEHSNVPPGSYLVNIYINNKKIGQEAITFTLQENKQKQLTLRPCLSKEMMEDYGILVPQTVVENDNCIDINSFEYTSDYFDFNKKNLHLSIPLQYISEEKNNDLRKKYWSDGISAFLLNYNVSGFNNFNTESSSNTYYANLQPQLNFGAWRLKSYITYYHSKDNNKWDTVNTYISRAIKTLNSEIALGEIYTQSLIFDATKIIGANLYSSTQMLPQNYTRYAPAISGIANSEAIVTIKQNDVIIYSKSVPAGPFSIIDYSPPSSSGNLYVTVKETDGTEKSFYIPYTMNNVLLRKGMMKYNLSSGQYNGQGNAKPIVTTLEMIYGLTDRLTILSGVQIADKYQSVSVGNGINMGAFGAFSGNIIYSNAKLDDDKTRRGNAIKLVYTKDLVESGTNLSVVGYKHFDSNFYFFNDFINYNKYDSANKLKNEFTVSVIQNLGTDFGQASLAMTKYQYRNGSVSSYIAGYINSFDRVNTNFNFNYIKDSNKNNKNDYVFSMNLSIPFNINDNNYWMSYGSSINRESETVNTVQVGGVNGETSQMSWNAYQGYNSINSVYSGGVGGAYRSSYGNVNASYSYTKDSSYTNYGAAGSLIISEYGVVAGAPLQQSNVLVRVDNGEGVKVKNNLSGETNSFGLLISPGLSDYRDNSIELNSATIPENIEIEHKIISNIVPTKGALVLANFENKVGYKLYINLNKKKEIPNGATARIGEYIGHVSLNNSLYIQSSDKVGTININWIKDDTMGNCNTNFNLDDTTPINGIYILNLSCE